MRKLGVFNFISLNGYFQGSKGDIRWHTHGAEEAEFAAKSSSGGAALLFGRVTYEMMASFWPTPDAFKMAPVVAENMNKAEKIVFSRTLKKADWKNTKVVKDNIVDEIRKLKQQSGSPMTLLGSGSILTQFAQAGLIDEYQFMLDPVVLGEGTPIFKGLQHKLNLKLTSTRTFGSGTILLSYVPMA